MEEILASIRRIISEDNAPAGAPPAEPEMPVAEAMDDVLELTELADEPPPAPPPPPPPPPPPIILQAPPPAPVFQPAPAPEPATPPRLPSAADAARLVSETTAVSSAAALAALGDTVRRRLVAETPIGTPGVTIEDIVRDLLRPMLRDWLDTYLPDIVERLVAEEVRRLSRDAAEHKR